MIAGNSKVVGLRSDGTVVAVGNDYDNMLDVNDWDDIVQIAAGRDHTVGLLSDGRVVALGRDDYGQLDVTELMLLIREHNDDGEDKERHRGGGSDLKLVYLALWGPT